jgi:hypothetical protein
MPLVFRPARADELQRAEELVVRSINDLTERHGFGPMATLRPPVSPGHQGRGVGNELLARTFEHARKAGATTKSLITFTFNVVSQGLYIRHGLLPRLPIYFVSVARDVLMTRLQGDKLVSTPIQPTASHLKTLTQLDVGTLGISREKHHRYLLSDGTMKGIFLHDGGDCVGYAYVSATGHVGPVAVAQASGMGGAFRTALDLAAASGAEQVSAFLPGVSEGLTIAVEHGMRITFPMVLVSTRDFGDWTRYLPRNPGHM